MTPPSYRPFDMADTPDFIRLIDEAFGYGFLFPDPDILQAFYMDSLAGLISASTFSEVALLDERVSGIAFCSAGFAPHEFKGFEPRMHELMSAERFRWLSHSREPRAAERKGEIDRTVSRVVSRLDRCDGDILFLVVSKEAKGLGIGRRLLEDMLDHMRAWCTSRVVVLTDDLCDFGFYDRMGFTCEASGTSTFDNGRTLTTYAYTMDLETDGRQSPLHTRPLRKTHHRRVGSVDRDRL